MEKGTFVGWLKKDGEFVRVGDALYELEGEKATQEIESIDEGILRIANDGPKPGDDVDVGMLLGCLIAKGESAPLRSSGMDSVQLSAQEPSGPRPYSPIQAASPSVRRLARELDVKLEQVEGSGRSGRVTKDDVRAAVGGDRVVSASLTDVTECTGTVASPRARRVAKELDIDWTRLTGSGRAGRVRESDVRRAAGQSTKPVAAWPADAAKTAAEPLELSSRREMIASRLRISRERTVPVTLTTTADATNLVGLREQFKSTRSDTVPSYSDIMICLIVPVLKRHRPMAARCDQDRRTMTLPSEDSFHIGLAVDTSDGLLVPVIRSVEKTPLIEVARRTQQLIDRARRGTLTLSEMQGSVFTLSNLGGAGIETFTPIINYPEIAILGMGAIRREPAVLPDGSIAARNRISLSLTFDHAAIDGAPAAAFLEDLAGAVENPAPHLLGQQSG
jgi:pyruvate dehydrogenase E2 component (dihydrolipoamide acetyltransferase)